MIKKILVAFILWFALSCSPADYPEVESSQIHIVKMEIHSRVTGNIVFLYWERTGRPSETMIEVIPVDDKDKYWIGMVAYTKIRK